MTHSRFRLGTRWFRASLLPVILLLASIFASPAWCFDSGVEVGQKVPEFSLPGLDGTPISFEKQIRGKAPLAILFFMTTACSACFEELKELDEFVRRNPGKVDVWCVAVDLRGATTVGLYQEANRFQVKYLIDPRFSLPRKFGFNYTPSLAIVDPHGVVLHKKGGYSPTESLPDLIRTFLK
jgi:peroxiredoxin